MENSRIARYLTVIGHNFQLDVYIGFMWAIRIAKHE